MELYSQVVAVDTRKLRQTFCIFVEALLEGINRTNKKNKERDIIKSTFGKRKNERERERRRNSERERERERDREVVGVIAREKVIVR